MSAFDLVLEVVADAAVVPRGEGEAGASTGGRRVGAESVAAG